MILRHAPLVALSVLIPLSGCVSSPIQATQSRPLQITYVSDPPGALVMDSAGKAWGRAPVTLAYPTSAQAFEHGQCVHPWSIMMRWPSGAEQTTQPVACPVNGLTQQLLVERPKDKPGLAQDVQFAGAYEQAQATRAAAAQQERAAIEAAAVQVQASNDAATLRALATLNREKPAQATSSNVHCTSRTVGQGQFAHTQTDCD